MVGGTGLDAGCTALVVTDGAANTVIAGVGASVTLTVTGYTYSVVSEIIVGACLNAESIKSKSFSCGAASAVFGIDVAGGTVRVACDALVDSCFVESFGTVECADSSYHDIGALIVASSIEENFVVGAGCAGGVGAKT